MHLVTTMHVLAEADQITRQPLSTMKLMSFARYAGAWLDRGW